MQESKDIDYTKQHHTPHCWLPAKVSRKLNHAFLLVDSFNFNFVDEERSDICHILPLCTTALRSIGQIFTEYFVIIIYTENTEYVIADAHMKQSVSKAYY